MVYTSLLVKHRNPFSQSIERTLRACVLRKMPSTSVQFRRLWDDRCASNLSMTNPLAASVPSASKVYAWFDRRRDLTSGRIRDSFVFEEDSLRICAFCLTHGDGRHHRRYLD